MDKKMDNILWEDNLLEKKLESDLKDLLKTLVAFSNSIKPGHKAVILIGEKDDGNIQGVSNPDNIQKKIRQEANKIYPPILWNSFVYENNGMKCVRVEIEYSGELPHFGGPAWIRKGSESVIASDEMFQQLIDTKTSMVFEISKWQNKTVTVHGDQSTVPPTRKGIGPFEGINQVFSHRWGWEEFARIVFVNSHWVTLEKIKDSKKISEPLNKLILSYDDENNQLKIIVEY